MPITKKDRDPNDPLVSKQIDVWQWLQPAKEAKKAPWYASFLRGISALFGKRVKSEELTGRFEEMDHAQKKLIEELTTLYSDLESAKEHELYVLREMVITPLIREGETLQRTLHSKEQATQVKAYAHYHRWTERAEHWLLSYATLESDELYELIKKEIVRGTIEKIVKDQQLLEHYLAQGLQQLSLSPGFYNSLYRRIKARISPHMHDLEHLKNNLEHLQLGELRSWKERVYSERLRHFDEAMAVIDEAMSEVTPSFTDYEEEERQFEIREQINSIEKLCPYIIHEIDKESLTEEQRLALLERLTILYHEAYRLSLDLHLPEEGADRLHGVLSSLMQAQELLSVQNEASGE